MPPLSILMKPASGNCNLRCKYCFYHSITGIRETESYGMMSCEMLEIIVSKALQFADGICTFTFQGGEPTLRGLDFYRRLVDLQKKYNTKSVKINNALQTNGMLIDNEWAGFLSENNFLVGISLDGPKDIHDAIRIGAGNKGSYNKVMNTVGLFNRLRVEYNILCVVSAYVARHIGKVYNFFKKNNFKYLQFIPCLDPLDENPGGREYSLTPERYTGFLKVLFDLWYEDIVNEDFISIRDFDNLIGILMGYPPEVCSMKGQCSCQFVIEADGGVYPCDFYVIDEWYLGNISEHGFAELASTDTARRFVEVSTYRNPKCSDCSWFSLCRNGCRRFREPLIEGRPALNYFCEAYSAFFVHAGERLHKLAAIFRERA